ncbi:MAG: hypothetical protein KTR21_09970 [Rhodobacteraceae bacterium]|nr:hypothetical protein [Paracoccaceae bacterium]
MFEEVQVEEGLVRARWRNPRLLAPDDWVALTDLGGRWLDLAIPGAPSARARRYGLAVPQAADEVVFPIAEAPPARRLTDQAGRAFWEVQADIDTPDHHAYWLYALHAGVAQRCTPPPPPDGLAERVDRLNAPLLAPSPLPCCTPREALVFGMPVAEAATGALADLLGREPALDLVSRAAEGGAARFSDRIIELSAHEVVWRGFGQTPVPAVSFFRTRTAHIARVRRVEPPPQPAVNAEQAFRALGLSFDPSLWSAAYYDDALAAVEGDLAAFVRRVDPLPLMALV